MTDIQLFTKLSELPSNLKAEVSDFIDYLMFKSKKKGKDNLELQYLYGHRVKVKLISKHLNILKSAAEATK